MRQQNAARLLHDTRSTIHEATKMLLPAGQGKVNVTESRSRCGGLLTECRWNGKYHGPRTTGVLTNRAPPLSGRWKRSLCHGVGAEDRAVQVARHQPLHLGPRAALPPAVLWFHWRSWAFKTYGRTARLVVLSTKLQITKFNFLPARGASIAPSPSGCPFILGALSSSFHWRFLVPS